MSLRGVSVQLLLDPQFDKSGHTPGRGLDARPLMKAPVRTTVSEAPPLPFSLLRLPGWGGVLLSWGKWGRARRTPPAQRPKFKTGGAGSAVVNTAVCYTALLGDAKQE